MIESFRTIRGELKRQDYPLDHLWALLHAIHTTADFEMERILYTDDHAVETLYNKVKDGTLKTIITDVTMVTSGIRKGALQRLGIEAKCYLNDPRCCINHPQPLLSKEGRIPGVGSFPQGLPSPQGEGSGVESFPQGLPSPREGSGVGSFPQGLPSPREGSGVGSSPQGLPSPQGEGLGVGSSPKEFPSPQGEGLGVGCTRTQAGIRLAVEEHPDALFVFGNAPTALMELCDLIRKGKAHPAGIIAAPVGFVHVRESKHMVKPFKDIPKIIVEGRKGGSNLAATLCNAIMTFDDAVQLKPGRDL